VIEKWEKKKIKIRKEMKGAKRRDDEKEGDGGTQTDMTERRHLYMVSHLVQMCLLHLYRPTCTDSIPGTNKC
jgi:hypothetical protein